jgi:hypothetical protein
MGMKCKCGGEVDLLTGRCKKCRRDVTEITSRKKDSDEEGPAIVRIG